MTNKYPNYNTKKKQKKKKPHNISFYIREWTIAFFKGVGILLPKDNINVCLENMLEVCDNLNDIPSSVVSNPWSVWERLKIAPNPHMTSHIIQLLASPTLVGSRRFEKKKKKKKKNHESIKQETVTANHVHYQAWKRKRNTTTTNSYIQLYNLMFDPGGVIAWHRIHECMILWHIQKIKKKKKKEKRKKKKKKGKKRPVTREAGYSGSK